MSSGIGHAHFVVVSLATLYFVVLTSSASTTNLLPTRLTQRADYHFGEHIPPCDHPGWFPQDFGLKDHSVFWYDGYYYLVSIYVPPSDPSPFVQDHFVYARSQDLCQWEELSPVLPTRQSGSWDEAAIWAPHVYEEGGVFYMYYTGVTRNYTQSILLASTTDPSDPGAWQKEQMLFQPNHPGMIWQNGQWADCRDPSVFKFGNQYYLYYSGLDIDGGIVGLATATSPYGPWLDMGRTLPAADHMLESPTLAEYQGIYYLFYNYTHHGEYYVIGSSPTGPWQNPLTLFPGWAHEVWKSPQGDWFTSFLTNYTVTISPLYWDQNYTPAHPFITFGKQLIYMPLVAIADSP